MIKAVILAAGLGTRLRGLVVDKPKCMVHVNGRPIVGWQISALLAAGLTDIAIVTGYHAEVLREYVEQTFPGAPIKFIHSEDYANTNNMYSLSMSRSYVGDADLLFMNADVAFDPEVIARLLRDQATAVAVDEGSYNEESMKVTRPIAGEYLTGISKQIEKGDSLGSSIDVYYLKSPDALVLFEECERIIHVEGQRKQWSELALDRLLKDGRIKMRSVDVAGLDWYEIDNQIDLAIAETLFTASALRRNPPRAYFIDLDGTIYLGGRNIEGASDFVRHAKSRGAHVVFLSNNSSKSHADYVKRLSQAGIVADEGSVLLSTDAMGAELRAQRISQAYVLGTKSMKKVLAQYGVAHTEVEPQAVLLGYHAEVTYRELAEVSLLLQRGDIPYYASHLDKVCPTERGPIPDAGAMIELLFATTGRRPQAAFGKPSIEFVRERMAMLSVRPDEAVMIGDRIYTDMALAHAAGMRFVGVLTGECQRHDYEGHKNIMIVSSVGHLLKSAIIGD